MGKQKTARVLNRLLGKKVCFQGKFAWGEEDRLKAMAEAQQAAVAEDLDASVDYLVLSDLSGGKTVQKKAASLNAKGASIQVLDADGFRKVVEPTGEEVLALIRGGKSCAPVLAKAIGGDHMVMMPVSIGAMSVYTPGAGGQITTFTAERLDRLDLTEFDLSRFAFEQCDFSGSTLTETALGFTKQCNFSRCTGGPASFADVERSRFAGADLRHAQLMNFSEADFTEATLENAQFSDGTGLFAGGRRPKPLLRCTFARAKLRLAKFHDLLLKSPVFREADLTHSVFAACELQTADFRNAILEGTSLMRCKLVGADFSGANLRGANFADADLTDAILDDADLASCNLRGAKLSGVNLSKARNYDPNNTAVGSIGPSLTELGKVASKARRIELHFQVRRSRDEEGERAGLDSNSLKYGWGITLPNSLSQGAYGMHHSSATTVPDALIEMGNALANWQVRFETVEVSSTKSPVGGKELRELVMKGISEAFAQPLPPDDELAAASKAYRETMREQNAADRERREQARKEAEKQKASEKKQIARKIAKTVGKVTDIATFLKALELRADKAKIDKATKMLKAERFKLFNDIADEHLSGVVKSQTDPDLVYACRIDHEGHYACCTQNLNICGGLRGSICKHLLVLIIGLVKAGELDPTTIDSWVAKTHDAKPELDKETMGAIFIKYKGAEAGEVDWRPTETLPEDYYAL